jgi:3-methyl-2-oxobutanoate hydroxymethyltransferase
LTLTSGKAVKRTTQDIINRKLKKHTKITALTAYDFPFAKLLDQADLDIILVGDSLGMVCLGYESTTSVTMDEMLHHLRAVRRAVTRSLLIADMPFGSYETPALALKNAYKLIEKGGAEGVKLEGGRQIEAQLKVLRDAEIPVMGHLGMLPQSIKKVGGYKVQGRDADEAKRILDDTRTLEQLGVFSVVLECVPFMLAKQISESIQIPTIGIGAGPHTDGQVLVLHDLLGFETGRKLRFVRNYGHLEKHISEALAAYKADVHSGKFPTLAESFK